MYVKYCPCVYIRERNAFIPSSSFRSVSLDPFIFSAEDIEQDTRWQRMKQHETFNTCRNVDFTVGNTFIFICRLPSLRRKATHCSYTRLKSDRDGQLRETSRYGNRCIPCDIGLLCEYLCSISVNRAIFASHWPLCAHAQNCEWSIKKKRIQRFYSILGSQVRCTSPPCRARSKSCNTALGTTR